MLKHFFKPTSIFEKLVDKSVKSICIKNSFYKKLCKKISTWYASGSTKYVCAYTRENFYLFHITNAVLARLIYTAIKSNSDLPEWLNSLKFITIEKEQKAVFAVYKREAEYYHSDFIIGNIDSSLVFIETFEKAFSIQYENIRIDYNVFFENYLNNDKHLIISLFLSITLSDFEFDDNCLKRVVNHIILYFNYYLTIDSLRSMLDNSDTNFFKWLNKGVYIPNTNDELFEDMPLPLYINILKFVITDSIKNIYNLFNFNDNLYKFPDAKALIFEPKIFNNSLVQTSEDDDLITYLHSDGCVVTKFKNILWDDENKFTKITDYLALNKLLNNPEFVYSDTGDIYLVEKISGPSFKKYIESIANDDSKFLTFLIHITDKFMNLPDIKNIHLKSDSDLLKCFHFESEEITFKGISNIAINPTNETVALDYPLILMEVIKKYLECSLINISQLLEKNFIKIFPPIFVNQLEIFLNTGKYYPKGLRGALRNILTAEFADKIIFIKEIPFDDTILTKLSFYDNITLPSNLQTAIDKAKTSINSSEYLSLDKMLPCLKNNSLTNRNLHNIFSGNTTDSDLVLCPQKVIICKNDSDDKSFQIAGVLWNHDSLKPALEVIKSKELNTLKVYALIARILKFYLEHHMHFGNHRCFPLKDFSTLFVEMSTLQPIFSSLSHMVYDNYVDEEYISIYYKRLINTFNEYADFSKNYDVFEAKEISSDETFEFGEFIQKINSLKECTRHPGHWHFKNDFCPVCKKTIIYEDNLTLNDELYKDDIAIFYDSKIDTIYRLASKNMTKCCNNVLLGLEHDLFNNFVGLFPEKVVLAKNKSQQSILGIKYPYLDFEKVITLDTFKHTQRLKVVLVLYKNLLPHILNKSFICTNMNIFSTIIMHKDFKSEILIPNLPLLECNIILSNDEQLKDTKSSETLSLFCKFITNYILSDEFLANLSNLDEYNMKEILNHIKNHDFESSKTEIKLLVELLSNYCTVHNIPFLATDHICSECEKDGINEQDICFKTSKYFEDLSSKTPTFDGGEANLYPYTSDSVQKIFKSNVDLKFKSKILAKALEKNPLIDEFNQKHEDIKIISVKELLYKKENGVVTLKGFIQPLIKDSFKISNLKDKNFVKEMGYTRKDIVNILIKVCKGIEFLHSIGGFIGDLNGGNVIVKDKVVYIIDIDGMSFDEVKNSVYTNLYIYPPSAESKNITKDDDWYSLAVQAFYYLTYSHPFRGVCNDSSVPANEIERMKLGISVLGEHDIIPASISIGWDFLPDNLIKYFLNTFEKGLRKSMLEILQNYYLNLEKNHLEFSDIIRKQNVLLNISEHTYVTTAKVLIYKENSLAYITNFREILLKNNKIIILLPNSTLVLDEESGKLFELNRSFDSGPMDVVDNEIYFTSSDCLNIYVQNLIDDSNTKLTAKNLDSPIVAICAVKKNKVVYVTNNANDNCFDIYCNTSKVYSLSKDLIQGSDIRVRIRYDDFSDKCLVMILSSSNSIGIVIERIESNISYFELEALSKFMYFYKNVLYYVCDGKIKLYNLNSQKTKTIDCPQATSNSIIYRQDNKFVIVNRDTAYMYTKS